MKSQRRSPNTMKLTKKSLPWRRATRIRIKMIAAERGLSDEEIAKALHCGTAAILAFAEKHEISLDWLVRGDLWGLLRTVRAHHRVGCRGPQRFPT